MQIRAALLIALICLQTVVPQAATLYVPSNQYSRSTDAGYSGGPYHLTYGDALGPFASTNQDNYTSPGYTGSAYADQTSTVTLSSNILSITALGHCNASESLLGENHYVYADSYLRIAFITDSLFFYTVRANLAQSETVPQQWDEDDETYLTLANATKAFFLFGDGNAQGRGPFSGTNYGILAPGNYTLEARSFFQSGAAPAFTYADTSHYEFLFLVRPLPTLAIQPLTTEQARLSWSTNYADFVPEATPSLLAPAWQALTNIVSAEGDRLFVTISTRDQGRLFRLRPNY